MEQLGSEMAKKFQAFKQVSWDYFQAWNNQTPQQPTILEVYIELRPNMPFYDIVEKKGELTIFMIPSEDTTSEPSIIIDPQTPDPSMIQNNEGEASNTFESFEGKQNSADASK